MHDDGDEHEEDDRRDEDVRRERWEMFIQVVLAFEETEKWSGVLAAVCRAMRDREEGKA